ncbi:hypothetical protein ILYODFUR_021184 [Ilyodon furcidens]|uniref:Secreted protein n=1 Tax=Ilyodon furcidens TaxID=33524 RepID=A0ABV0U046_9TELE
MMVFQTPKMKLLLYFLLVFLGMRPGSYLLSSRDKLSVFINKRSHFSSVRGQTGHVPVHTKENPGYPDCRLLFPVTPETAAAAVSIFLPFACHRCCGETALHQVCEQLLCLTSFHLAKQHFRLCIRAVPREPPHRQECRGKGTSEVETMAPFFF